MSVSHSLKDIRIIIGKASYPINRYGRPKGMDMEVDYFAKLDKPHYKCEFHNSSFESWLLTRKHLEEI